MSAQDGTMTTSAKTIPSGKLTTGHTKHTMQGI
nr:MAG TPA: hypothetical protein [Inoviridae sp.]